MRDTKTLRKTQAPATTGARLRVILTKLDDTSAEIAIGGHRTERLLELLSHQRDLGNRALDLGIIMSREKGASWRTISTALKLSPQAVEQRMRRLSTSVDGARVQAISA
jgi:hypothetical protein